MRKKAKYRLTALSPNELLSHIDSYSERLLSGAGTYRAYLSWSLITMLALVRCKNTVRRTHM